MSAGSPAEPATEDAPPARARPEGGALPAAHVGATPERRLSGLTCMVLAVIGFSIMAACVKVIGPRIPSHEKILLRSLATVPVLMLMIRRLGLSPWGSDRKLLLMRGTFGCAGMLAYFVSLAHLPMGNAVLLTHASPIFSAYFASRFLGERAGRAVWIASAACLAGVALVARPTPHAELLYTAIAFGSAAVNGATYTIVRASAQKDHHLVVALSLPLVCIPVTALMTAFEWVTPDAREWWLLAAMTLASIVAQIFMTMGIQRETASRATNVFFLGVVLAVIWGQALGDPPLQPLDWAGALLICASIVALALARGRGPTLGRLA